MKKWQSLKIKEILKYFIFDLLFLLATLVSIGAGEKVLTTVSQRFGWNFFVNRLCVH